jgi:hypothetical protein
MIVPLGLAEIPAFIFPESLGQFHFSGLAKFHTTPANILWTFNVMVVLRIEENIIDRITIENNTISQKYIFWFRNTTTATLILPLLSFDRLLCILFPIWYALCGILCQKYSFISTR